MPAKAARRARGAVIGGPDGPPHMLLRISGDTDGEVEEYDLGYLLFKGSISGKPQERIRSAVIQGFDNLLVNHEFLEGTTGYGPGEFRHVLGGFTRGIMSDRSRPFFRGHRPISCGVGDGCRMKMSHLLLAVLLYIRGIPVQGGLAAVLRSDAATASRYLEYGMTVCGRVLPTPEREAARLMNVLRRGSYDELELVAPGLTLYLERAEIQYLRIVAYDRKTGVQEAARGDDRDALAVRTGRGTVIGIWEMPSDGTYLDALGRCIPGRGFLGELTRPLPDGRRWTIVPGRFLVGNTRDGPGCGRHIFLEQDTARGDGPARGAYDPNRMMQLVWGMANSSTDWNGGDPGVLPVLQPSRASGRGASAGVQRATRKPGVPRLTSVPDRKPGGSRPLRPGSPDPSSMNVQKGANSAAPRTGQAGRDSAAARADARANPYLEDLVRQCSAAGDPEGMRGAVLHRLDDILSDTILLIQTTGQDKRGFLSILRGFTEEMEDDESCPLLHCGPAGPGARHLLLMVLMNSRCGPVLDGLAAIFGVDDYTAAEYLEYGRSVCSRITDLPETAAARLIDAIDRGAYNEAEQEAPGFALAATFENVRPLPRDGTPPGMLGGPYSRLLVFTANSVMVGAWTEPGGATGAEVFRRYISGGGRHLAELVRPLPDGRSWTIGYSGGLDGIEGLLPGVDVWPDDDPRFDAKIYGRGA